jgi:polyhydroxyalkanoate synthesis regulator phasin
MDENLERIKEERARAGTQADSRAIESILDILHDLSPLAGKMDEVLAALQAAKDEAVNRKDQLDRVTGKVDNLETTISDIKTEVDFIKNNQRRRPISEGGVCRLCLTGRLIIYIGLAIGGFIFLGAAITLAAQGVWTAEDVRSFLPGKS